MADGQLAPIVMERPWSFLDIRFPLSEGDYAEVVLSVSGERTSERVTGDRYLTMLAAIQTPAPGEDKITTTDGTPDLPRILRFRLARWVAANVLSGATAVPHTK